jgi:hypothetical protein
MVSRFEAGVYRAKRPVLFQTMRRVPVKAQWNGGEGSQCDI